MSVKTAAVVKTFEGNKFAATKVTSDKILGQFSIKVIIHLLNKINIVLQLIWYENALKNTFFRGVWKLKVKCVH